MLIAQSRLLYSSLFSFIFYLRRSRRLCGVTAAAPVAVAAAAEEEGPAANVTVILKEVGPTKVKVIKAVREITGLGLVDAKGLVDKVPSEIKKDVPAEEGAKLKETLEAAGAVVELK